MSKFKDVYNLQSQIFKPETLDLSEKELKKLMRKLLEYQTFTVDKGGSSEPYDIDSPYSKKWFKAYEHLLVLISMKQQNFKYYLSLILSIIAIVITGFGLYINFPPDFQS